MIQVKTSDEESKEGVAPGLELTELVKVIHEECTRLHLQGLMTIGQEGDLEAFNVGFELTQRLRLVRADVAKHTGRPEESFELSMGMSGDFEAAIKHGSTCVRVGSSIFGARDYSKK